MKSKIITEVTKDFQSIASKMAGDHLLKIAKNREIIPEALH
jgi:hypothetical protein